MSEERIIDVCISCTFWGIVGGRIFFVFENWSLFGENLLRTLLFLKYPGFSLLGGSLAFVLSLMLFGYLSRLKIGEVLDLFAVPLVFSAGFSVLPCAVLSCVTVQASRVVVSLLGLLIAIYFLQKIKNSLYNDSRYGRVKRKQGLVFSLSMCVLLSFGLAIAKNLIPSLYFVERIFLGLFILFIVVWYWDIIRMIKFPTSVLGQIRKYLEDKLRDTEHRLAQLRRDDPTSDKDRLHTESSDDDTATDKAKHERIQALQTQLNRSVIEMRKALTKIKVGSYGNCENCGKLIDTDRLAAMPQATLCMDCERKKEKKAK